MEQIYKMIPSSNFEPKAVEYHPYVEREHKFCQYCGAENKVDVTELRGYSAYTGNAIHKLFYVCTNNHASDPFLNVFRWKEDGKLYTGDFIDPVEYIESLTITKPRSK